MKYKTFILPSILGLLLINLSIGQVGDGGLPGAFLDYGASPRTLALGKSFTGLANDAEAVYFNPGGLAHLYSQDVKLAHSALYGGNRMES
jgi:hypothetical protein